MKKRAMFTFCIFFFPGFLYLYWTAGGIWGNPEKTPLVVVESNSVNGPTMVMKFNKQTVKFYSEHNVKGGKYYHYDEKTGEMDLEMQFSEISPESNTEALVKEPVCIYYRLRSEEKETGDLESATRFRITSKKGKLHLKPGGKGVVSIDLTENVIVNGYKEATATETRRPSETERPITMLYTDDLQVDFMKKTIAIPKLVHTHHKDSNQGDVFIIQAVGAQGDMHLEQVVFQKDVKIRMFAPLWQSGMSKQAGKTDKKRDHSGKNPGQKEQSPQNSPKDSEKKDSEKKEHKDPEKKEHKDPEKKEHKDSEKKEHTKKTDIDENLSLDWVLSECDGPMEVQYTKKDKAMHIVQHNKVRMQGKEARLYCQTLDMRGAKLKETGRFFLEKVDATGQIRFWDGYAGARNRAKADSLHLRNFINGESKIILEGKPRISLESLGDFSLAGPKLRSQLQKEQARRQIRTVYGECESRIEWLRRPEKDSLPPEEEFTFYDKVYLRQISEKLKLLDLTCDKAYLLAENEERQNRTPVLLRAYGNVLITQERGEGKGDFFEWKRISREQYQITLKENPSLFLTNMAGSGVIDKNVLSFSTKKPAQPLKKPAGYSQKQDSMAFHNAGEKPPAKAENVLTEKSPANAEKTSDKNGKLTAKDAAPTKKMEDIRVFSEGEMVLISSQSDRGRTMDYKTSKNVKVLRYQAGTKELTGDLYCQNLEMKAVSRQNRKETNDTSPNKEERKKQDKNSSKNDPLGQGSMQIQYLKASQQVKFTSPEVKGGADSLIFEEKQGKNFIHLSGNGWLENEQGKLTAKEISYDGNLELFKAVSDEVKLDSKELCARGQIMEYYRKEERMELFGKPAVVWQIAEDGQSNYKLHADKMEYSHNSGKMHARENIRLFFTADSGKFDSFQSKNQAAEKNEKIEVPKQAIVEAPKKDTEKSKNGSTLKHDSGLVSKQESGKVQNQDSGNDKKQSSGERKKSDVPKQSGLVDKKQLKESAPKKYLLTTDSITAQFDAEKKTLENFKAYGNVVIKPIADEKKQETKGEEIQGDWLIYKGNTAILSGKPAKIHYEGSTIASNLITTNTKNRNTVCDGPAQVNLNTKKQKMMLFPGKGKEEPVLVTCDGKIRFTDEKEIVLEDNVVVTTSDARLSCDRLKIMLEGQKVSSLVGLKNVKIVSQENTATADQLRWEENSSLVLLTGNPSVHLSSNDFQMDAPAIWYHTQERRFFTRGRNIVIERKP